MQIRLVFNFGPSIATTAVFDFPELGSNLENWQNCAKLAEIAIEFEPLSFYAKKWKKIRKFSTI